MTTRTRVCRVAASLAALVMAAGGAVSTASAAPQAPVDEHAEMQRLLDTIRRENSAPGVGITFGHGRHDATMSSGARNIVTNQPIDSTNKVRVGSGTKMFVAAVVLQLVDEGRLDLDLPIERYLPGVLRYPADKVPGDPAAYDGRTVTLRQLLQHTAGVVDYADLPYVLNPLHQIVPPTDQDHLDHALPQGPTFLPGSAWRYSNTHYTLIGMIVRATTGHSIGDEIAGRIVEPLGLDNTFFADRGQRFVPGEHVRGYLTSMIPLDVTNFEPGVWGTAGALVSSPDDMNTFIAALLDGEVVSPVLLTEMQDHVPMGGGASYGLGLANVPLSCGEAWGHAGFLAGYYTLSLGLTNGRRAFFTLNTSVAVGLNPPAAVVGPSNPAPIVDLVELALC